MKVKRGEKGNCVCLVRVRPRVFVKRIVNALFVVLNCNYYFFIRLLYIVYRYITNHIYERVCTRSYSFSTKIVNIRRKYDWDVLVPILLRVLVLSLIVFKEK